MILSKLSSVEVANGLNRRTGIDSTIRDSIPGIRRNRLDAKEHAQGT